MSHESSAEALFRREMEAFSGALQQLGENTEQAAGIWQDTQYDALAAAIHAMLGDATRLLEAGERSDAAWRSFAAIAQEEY